MAATGRAAQAPLSAGRQADNLRRPKDITVPCPASGIQERERKIYLQQVARIGYCSDQIPRLLTRARPRRIQLGDGSVNISSVMPHAIFAECFGSCDRTAANLRLNESSRRLLYTDAMLYESMSISSTSFDRLDLCGSRHRMTGAGCRLTRGVAFRSHCVRSRGKMHKTTCDAWRCTSRYPPPSSARQSLTHRGGIRQCRCSGAR
jgi:hypothetical protein